MGEIEAEAREWLHRAEVDLQVAEYLLEKADLPGDVACFHLQQAVEKALKGLLIVAGIAPPGSHDLRALYAMVRDQTPRVDLDTLDALSPFAVIGRYPGFGAEPAADLVNRFVRLASAAVDALKRALP